VTLETPPATDALRTLAQAGTPRATVLLVDDRPENLVALEAILAPLGQELVRANSGEEALRELLRRDVALILLDVMMPGLDGIETARMIRDRERTRSVPIVFLTAISRDAEQVARGYEAGGVDYVTKPFDPHVLRSKVATFVELWQSKEQLKRQSEELHRAQLDALERASEERYRALIEAMPQQVWTARPDGALDYVNDRCVDYFGVEAHELLAAGWTGVLHPEDVPRALERWRLSLVSGEAYEIDFRLRRADGLYRWHLGRAVAVRDDAGEVASWLGTNTDVDDQRRAEEAQRFLLAAGSLLGGSLDVERTLGEATELVVSRLGDWCALFMRDDSGVAPLAVQHRDPNLRAVARELADAFAADADGPLARVLAAGRMHLETLEEEPEPDESRRMSLLRALGLRDVISVPLSVRGQVVGAISLGHEGGAREYRLDDLMVLEELARRASVALENARLYGEVQRQAQAAGVLASVADGVFLVDRRGRIRLWNRAAETITGLPAATVEGKRPADVLPGWADLSELIPVVTTPGTEELPETVPLELDGKEVWLSVSGVRSGDGTVYAFRDLTATRAIEAMKSDFVATVSHELRTPLAAIYGAAMTVNRADVELEPDIRTRLLQVVVDESDRLARIVNDLLLASQLEARRMTTSVERTDPLPVARAVVDAARLAAPDGIALKLRGGRVPAVATDPGHLHQVLANLVDNAIKYSPGGGTVELALESDGPSVRLLVRDEGLGIPRGEHRRVFEKFYRLDPNMTQGVGGTGLGLYICRELVRRVNGRIWVEQNEPHGSVFVVELPRAEKAAPKRKRPAKA
jgi:PAS domain S-box-containing protein